MTEIEPKYMMATKAYHLMGDISTETPDLCVVHGEEGDNWVGNWVTGFGVYEREVSKATTRNPTHQGKKPTKKVGFPTPALSPQKLNTPKPKTKKLETGINVVYSPPSTYQFPNGSAEKNGGKILRSKKSLHTRTNMKEKSVAVEEELVEG